VFAFDDDYSMGVLTSRMHGEWARAQSSTLRIDVRYTPTTAFETFPWPSPTPEQREAIAALARASVDHDVACFNRVVDIGQLLGRPGPRREHRLRTWALAALELTGKRFQPAVEQRGVVAGGAEHPDQAGGHHAPGVVIGHDDVVVSDAELGHARGERLRVGERVAAVFGAGRTRERAIKVDEDRAGEVPGLIRGAAGSVAISQFAVPTP